MNTFFLQCKVLYNFHTFNTKIVNYSFCLNKKKKKLEENFRYNSNRNFYLKLYQARVEIKKGNLFLVFSVFSLSFFSLLFYSLGRLGAGFIIVDFACLLRLGNKWLLFLMPGIFFLSAYHVLDIFNQYYFRKQWQYSIFCRKHCR